MAKVKLFSNLFGAVPFNESAVLVSDTAPRAMGYFAFLGWYSTGIGEVAFADAAVHAAGCDEFGGKFGLHNIV